MSSAPDTSVQLSIEPVDHRRRPQANHHEYQWSHHQQPQPQQQQQHSHSNSTPSSSPPPPPPHHHHLDDIHEESIGDFSCGFLRWHPAWLQGYANKQTFLALFCLTSVLQGVYYTYFVSVLTTIEKLYQIPSKTTGIIMSSTEIGQISGAMLLTYYGGQGHRPRWIASGMVVFALAALLCSTPHYFFGSQPAMTSTTTTVASSLSLQPSLCHLNRTTTPAAFGNFTDAAAATCGQESAVVVRRSLVTTWVLAIFFMSLLLIGLGTTAVNTLGIPYLDDNVAPKESPLYFAITIGVRILGPVCGFLLGSLCTNIYVDFLFEATDLTPTDSNWIGAWWLGLFLVGISLMFTSIPMAIFPKRLPKPDPNSYCHQMQQELLTFNDNNRKEAMKLNTESSDDWEEEEAETDVQTIPSTNGKLATDETRLPMEMNIGKLDAVDDDWQEESNNVSQTEPSTNGKSNGQQQQQQQQQALVVGTTETDSGTVSTVTFKKKEKLTLGGFGKALKRLLSNRILLCRTASSVLHILPISGLYTFLPKYLESQFQLTAGHANIISGLAGILVMGFGVFTSGIIMRKFNPSARVVAFWIALSALLYVLGMLALMSIGCPNTPFVGLEGDELITKIDQPNLLGPLECSKDCRCPRGRFEPVCVGGYTYNSPCIAGCRSFVNSTSDKRYLDCSCSPPPSTTSPGASPPANGLGSFVGKPGLCALECNTLTKYIIIFSLTVLIHSTSEVGSMLLTLRCVQPQDKAMALGFLSFATSLFGNVPCPILYGAIVDSTCLFWEEDCGKRGACRMYDSTRFRYLFHGLTALIMFLAFLIDLVVCYKAPAIQFLEQAAEHDDDDDEDEIDEEKAKELEIAELEIPLSKLQLYEDYVEAQRRQGQHKNNKASMF